MQTRQRLTDTAFVKLQLVENTEIPIDGRKPNMKVRGEFANFKKMTQNHRLYPREVWEKCISELKDALRERRCFGEGDHPSDGKSSIGRISHIITHLEIDEANGIVIGEAEIFPTEKGRNIIILFENNCKVGVSSRGYGSVKSNGKYDVVQKDYRLVTFDFVVDPADDTAYPEVISESIQSDPILEGIPIDPAFDDSLFEDDSDSILDIQIKALDEAKAALQEELSNKFLQDFQVQVELAEHQIRNELQAEFAAREVRVTDLEINQLQEQNNKLQEDKNKIEKELEELRVEHTQLGKMARTAMYKFYLLKELNNNPDQNLIRTLLGDVESYSNIAELSDKLNNISKTLHEQREEENKKQALINKKLEEERIAKNKLLQQIRDSEAKLEEQKAQHEQEMYQLQEAYNQALAEKNRAEILQESEDEIAGSPNASQMRKVLRTAKPNTKQQATRLIESLEKPAVDSTINNDLKARLREKLGGRGRGNHPHDQELPTQHLSEQYQDPRYQQQNPYAQQGPYQPKPQGKVGVQGYNGTGLDMDTIVALSGIR